MSVRPAGASSSAEEKPPTSWALLVGVSHYEDDSIPALPFAAADARAVRDVLVDPRRGGIPPENVALLTDDATDPKLKPTRLNVLARLRAWAALAGPRDTFLFYFSGHGIAEKGKGYLLGSDARVGVLSDSALSTDRIDQVLGDSKAKSTLLLLDACHSGPGRDLEVMAPALAEGLFTDADGRVTLASCRESQQSFDWREKGHGVFSYYLAEGLGGQADADHNGLVTIMELSSYTHDQVVRWAAENGRQQEPRSVLNISGDFVVARTERAAMGSVPTGGSVGVLPAKLHVESEPAGARVLVDGVSQGTTPCDIAVAAASTPREHRVALEKDGCYSERMIMALGEGQVVPLQLVLDRKPAPGTAGGSGTIWVPADDGLRAHLRFRQMLDGLLMLDTSPRYRLAPPQRWQIASILLPLRARKDVSPEERLGAVARVLPRLDAGQKAAVVSMMHVPVPPEEARLLIQRYSQRGGTAWRQHRFFGHIIPRRKH